jgi:hypothetical protein
MKIISFTKWSRIILFATACAHFCGQASQAASISYQVNLNTSSLVGDANGPFSLDFQLNQGSGLATNMVSLINFSFTGGSATGSPNLSGGATGSLSSSVILTDATSPFNEFFQTFSAGTTAIAFYVTMTTNVDPVIPDSFSMAILNSALANIATTGLGDSLMLVNITASNLTLSDVQTFTSAAPDAGVTVTATPEPGTVYLLMGAAGLIAALSYKRRDAPKQSR